MELIGWWSLGNYTKLGFVPIRKENRNIEIFWLSGVERINENSQSNSWKFVTFDRFFNLNLKIRLPDNFNLEYRVTSSILRVFQSTDIEEGKYPNKANQIRE